jgi:beta-1,4-mannosyltransferase
MSQADSSTQTSDRRRAKQQHVIVMVLGDIGRSPRMQYHTLSLLEDGHYVTLIGYAGENLIQPLEMALHRRSTEANNNTTDEVDKPAYYGNLHLLRMTPYQLPKTFPLYRLLYYPIRLLSLSYCVIYTLWIELSNVLPHTKNIMPASVILVQNPPSMPTLLLAYLYCVYQGIRNKHRPRMVIDWHNLGYTMFEQPERSMVKQTIRKLAKWYERRMAPLADAHLTVTQAMEIWLGENFHIHGTNVRVLYDKPPVMFRPTSPKEQHELFTRLNLDDGGLLPMSYSTKDDNGGGGGGGGGGLGSILSSLVKRNNEQIVDETIFTQSIREGNGKIIYRLRRDRPALVVSSTSWTADEDFSILLIALQNLHKKIDAMTSDESSTTTFPKILVIVTGKGPQKAYYKPLLKEFNDTHTIINIQTLWLEATDYPTLLGCATLGISLHTSTSGLDLPMKVLDFFGCEVPVCAIGFDCLPELVQDGVNGNIFTSGDGLSTLLLDLLCNYNSCNNNGTLKNDKLDLYRNNIRGMTRWKENWEECARNIILGE